MSTAEALGSVLDEIIEACAGVEDPAVVARARGQFEERRGRILQDEELWEGATRCFLEWFVLEAPSEDEDLRPRAARELDSAAPERKALVLAWLRSHRSLCRVDAVASDHLDLTDLVGGGQFRVREERAFQGITRGDVMEARLVGAEESVYLGRGFVFHPEGTGAVIEQQVCAIHESGGSRDDVVDFCASLRVRCLRYKHVTELRVYENAAGEAASFVAGIQR